MKVKNLKLSEPQDKPLVILLTWLMAKRKHIFKFADLYAGHGFDILNVNVSPWQFMWPNKGTKVKYIYLYLFHYFMSASSGGSQRHIEVS